MLAYLGWDQLGSLHRKIFKRNILEVFHDLFRYGSPSDGYLVANQTLYGMLWLSQYEFATPERESKLGTMMWPEW